MRRHHLLMDLTMRSGGAALLCMAALSVKQLSPYVGLAVERQSPILYVLALVAFVTASAGAAMLSYGHHLFDTVEVSARWRRLAQQDRSERSQRQSS